MSRALARVEDQGFALLLMAVKVGVPMERQMMGIAQVQIDLQRVMHDQDAALVATVVAAAAPQS